MNGSVRPRISIIIPVYNVEKYLTECLASVCAQTYADFEAIVVNDGSKDGSLRICHEFAARDKRIKVIDQENQGVVIARQVGVSHSSGEYLIFLDADDYLRSDCLEKIIGVLDTYDPDVIVYGGYYRTDDSVKEIEAPYEAGPHDRDWIRKEIYPTIIQTDDCRYFSPTVHEKVFRRSLYIENQLTDVMAMIGEDMACSIPCLCNASNVFILNEYLSYIRCNPESVTRARKVFNWDCAENIARHVSEKIDLSEYDLQMQLDRYVAHMVFSIACSQFNSGASYQTVKRDILTHISAPCYAQAIARSRFKLFSEGWFARLALRYRQVWLMRAYERHLK